MRRVYIKDAIIVNEGKRFLGSVIIANQCIEEIIVGDNIPSCNYDEVIDASGCFLIPGVIDDHVHFREPGLTHKADISSESRAAVAGGVTSIMDMPNTTPLTITLEALNNKLDLYKEKSLVNYSCYLGATNDNADLLRTVDPHTVCGVKLFMGSSTGNMLVDRISTLDRIFSESNIIIAAHCEDQNEIRCNTNKYEDHKTDDDLPISYHPLIRSREACFSSSKLAVELAQKHNAKLHLLHISTADELSLLSNAPLADKRITAEACVSHLIFADNDYEHLGTKIKCNPAIKSANDKKALRDGVNCGLIDVIATDHAPHNIEEKAGGALKAVSGMPMIQFSLVSMLELVDDEVFTIETIVDKMCHAPATIFEINERGFIRKGYKADLVLVKPESPWVVTEDIILSKCKWSPLDGHKFHWKVEKTFVNGKMVFDGNTIIDDTKGQQLTFR